uniref:Major facilitator superfamily associated domain-containing protein n=1 Tax=Marmota marmota marmota TaxID=9994 RepID=A0A8C6A330_MARMA
ISANPQWDVSRALGVARLFHLVCGVRDACVTRFLTLYLRQLGLAAPWVGILMGTKHLIAAFWAPFCPFLAKSYQKRRVLLIVSLLGSVGASPFMVLIPALDKDLEYHSCNRSSRVTTTVVPTGVTLAVNSIPVQESASKHSAGGAPSLPARRDPRMVEASGLRNGPGESDQEMFSDLYKYSVDSTEGDLASPGTERPLSTMFQSHFYGGGCSLGSFVGGFVAMHFSLAVLYQACCVLLLLWLALFLSVQLRLPQDRKINYSKLLTVEGGDTSDSKQGSERDWFVKVMREEHSDWKG